MNPGLILTKGCMHMTNGNAPSLFLTKNVVYLVYIGKLITFLIISFVVRSIC